MNLTLWRVVFALGLVAAAVAAIVIGLNGPDQHTGVSTGTTSRSTTELVETPNFDGAIALALSDYEANNARTEGAPQQQVVNGWIARDILEIVARQNEARADTLDTIANMQAIENANTLRLIANTAPDDRPARLLVVMTMTIAWIALWAGLAWHPQSVGIMAPTEPEHAPLTATSDARSTPSVPDDHSAL